MTRSGHCRALHEAPWLLEITNHACFWHAKGARRRCSSRRTAGRSIRWAADSLNGEMHVRNRRAEPHNFHRPRFRSHGASSNNGSLHARKVYDSGSKTFSLSKERFFLVCGLWIAVMEGEPLPIRTYNHVAFKIDDADYDSYLARIRSLGLELREGRSRVEGEVDLSISTITTITCSNFTQARLSSDWLATAEADRAMTANGRFCCKSLRL
jgi:hypothetical protein